MKIAHIKAKTADFIKRSCVEQISCSYRAAIDKLKCLVCTDYTLVRAMGDRSVPITDNLRDTRDLRVDIAENIEDIDIIRKRYAIVIKYLEHPVRARVEFDSHQEFEQIAYSNKNSILSSIKDVRVGDAVDFVLLDADKTCVGFSREYLDDNHNWVSLDVAPYVTGWKVMIADPVNRFNLFTNLAV